MRAAATHAGPRFILSHVKVSYYESIILGLNVLYKIELYVIEFDERLRLIPLYARGVR